MSSHIHPCSECPFRKGALPGWVGGHTDSNEIVDIVYADVKFPCHKEVNKIKEFLKSHNDEDDSLSMTDDQMLEQAYKEAPHCVGALAFMNNSCKLSRDRKIAVQQKAIGKRDDVFASKKEMEIHHSKFKKVSR